MHKSGGGGLARRMLCIYIALIGREESCFKGKRSPSNLLLKTYFISISSPNSFRLSFTMALVIIPNLVGVEDFSFVRPSLKAALPPASSLLRYLHRVLLLAPVLYIFMALLKQKRDDRETLLSTSRGPELWRRAFVAENPGFSGERAASRKGRCWGG